MKLLFQTILYFLIFLFPTTLFANVTALEMFTLNDGTASFSVDDSAGNDSSANNEIIRTHDDIRYRVTFVTDGGDSAVTGTFVFPTIDAGPTAGEPTAKWKEIPPQCLASGSSLSADGGTLICNMGDFPNPSTVAIEPIATVSGRTPNGQEIDFAVSVDGEGSATAQSTEMATAIEASYYDTVVTAGVASKGVLAVDGRLDQVVSAAPRFDLMMGNSLNHGTTYIRASGFNGLGGPNGEAGRSIAYGVFMFAHELKGSEMLNPNIPFEYTVTTTDANISGQASLQTALDNSKLVSWTGAKGNQGQNLNPGCKNGPLNGYHMPGDTGTFNSNTTHVLGGGTVNCSQASDGQPIVATVSNIDSSLERFPTYLRAGGGTNPTDNNEWYVMSKIVSQYLFLDDIPEDTTVTLNTCVRMTTAPVSISGQVNVDVNPYVDVEDNAGLGNQCSSESFKRDLLGSTHMVYSVWSGSSTSAGQDVRITGDSRVNMAKPGEQYYSRIYAYNNASETLKYRMCEKIDNARQKLLTGSERGNLQAINPRNGAEEPSNIEWGVKVADGTGSIHDSWGEYTNVNLVQNGGDAYSLSPSVGSGTLYEEANCGDADPSGNTAGVPEAWFPDHQAVMDAGYSLDQITMLRVDGNLTAGGQIFAYSIHEARETFRYDANDVLLNPIGTDLNYSQGDFIPSGSHIPNMMTGMIYDMNGTEVRRDRQRDALEVGENRFLRIRQSSVPSAGLEVAVGNSIEYTLTPNYSSPSSNLTPANITVTNVLPENMTYVSTTSGPTPLVMNNTPSLGFTTLVWTMANQVPIQQTYGGRDFSTAANLSPIVFQARVNTNSVSGDKLVNWVTLSDGGNDSPLERDCTDYNTSMVNDEYVGYANCLPAYGSAVVKAEKTLNLVSAPPGFQIFTEGLDPIVSVASTYRNTINWASIGSSMNDLKVIDIFPYNGDVRGSSFTGTNTLVSVAKNSELNSSTATLYYTKALASSINSDPSDASNVLDGSSIWCDMGDDATTPDVGSAGCPLNLGEATALLVNQTSLLLAGTTYGAELLFTQTANKEHDVYKNSISAQGSSINLISSNSVETEVLTPSIVSRVWNDANRNGVVDNSESGFSSVRVTLGGNDIDGTAINIFADTNASGYYEFNLSNGLIKASDANGYTLSVSNPPAGMVTTYDVDDGYHYPNTATTQHNSGSIVLNAADDLTNVHFGYATPFVLSVGIDVNDSVTSSGGVALTDIFGNDNVNGATFTLGTDANITQITTTTLLDINLTTGMVTVPTNTPAGIYTENYTVCENTNPSNCMTADIRVTVLAGDIVLVNDSNASVNGSDGGLAIADITANDRLDTTLISLGVDANITVAGNTPLEVNLTTGSVRVLAGTVAGTHIETYTLCENLNPNNCEDANITVVVDAAPILGVDDSNNSINGSNGGTAIANVTANDTLNGNAVTLGTDVNITSVSNVDFMINPTTGAVTVPSQTAAGVYTEQYTLCEMLNPSNCVERNVTITVNPALIDAVDDDFASTIVLNTLGGVAGDVTATGNDSLNGMDVNDSLVALSVVSTDNNLTGVTIDANGSLNIEANTSAGNYVVTYSLCEVLNPTSCDEANVTVVVLVDTDMDGVADSIDRDDDNDGVLDSVEGFLDLEYQLIPQNNTTILNTLSCSNNTPFTTVTKSGNWNYTYSTFEDQANIDGEAHELEFDRSLSSFSVFLYSVQEINTLYLHNFTLTLDDGTVLSNSDFLLDDINNMTAMERNSTEYDTLTNNVAQPLTKMTYLGNHAVILTIENSVNDQGYGMLRFDTSLAVKKFSLVIDRTDTQPHGVISFKVFGNPTAYTCNDDNDNIPNHLDLDSDNDGIPDNVEAQTTNGYIAPSGTVDENGTFSTIYGVNGIVAVDSDEDNISDMLDSDSDNDGVVDINESGLTLTGADTNNDGIDDGVNASYADVNGDVNNPSNDLSNASGDTTEIAYREVPIVASNDIGITVNGSLGGQAIANVSVNDTLNGNSFTLGVDVNMTVAGNTPLVINVITGEVSVAVGTVAGTYVETYTICENANPSNCDDANVSVVVSTATILGTDDSNNSVNGSNGGTAIANVTANDTLNGNAVTLGTDVNITSVSNVDFMINPTTGAVTVSSQTAAGVYTEQYTLCEMLNPSNCVERNVTITVNPALIDAVDDDFASTIVLNTVGGVAGDVTATGNDSLNGMDVNDSLITLSIVSIENNLTGVTLDNNGSLSIEANATVGVYRVRYELCEVLNPTNCDEATARVIVLADTDVDGVADVSDLDNDNDGILDINEGNFVCRTFGADANGNTITEAIVPTVNSAFNQSIFGKDEVYFGGDTDSNLSGINLGVSASPLISVETYDLVALGEITLKGTFYNRILSNLYNESYLGILPATYTNINPLTGIPYIEREGVIAGAYQGGALIADLKDDATDSAILLNGGSTYLVGTWYDIQVTFAIESGNLVVRDFFVDGQKAGGTHIIGPVANYPWLNNIRIALAADDLASELCQTTFIDTDGDSIHNYLDLDSDNDGIPDNVEAQSTANYLAPSGTVDINGTWSAIYGLNGLVPVDTDEDNTSDYLDSDADNDGVADINESGLTLTGTDANNDGIDDVVNASYVDVNGDVNNPSNDLSNASGDTTEIAYREVPIVASNDTGITVNGSLGGQAIANVSVNDTLNGNSFTLGVDVNMTVAGNTPLVINVITGEVSVAVGTVAGTYVETYTICENTNPSNCADANVSVLVSTATILGTDDSNNSVNGSNGGTAIANVTANDTLNGNAVTLGTDVNITSVSNVDFMIDPSTGAVTVPSQTAAGVYTEQYTLCEMLNPSNCVERNVTITVNPALIDAVDDDFASTIVLNTVGGVAGDITEAGNDSLNGIDVNDSLITLSIVSTDNNLTSVTIDANGSLNIAANTSAGNYVVTYSLCEVLNPTNCDEANVTVVVLADTDMDGVADSIDHDDDNDGILDGFECMEPIIVTPTFVSTNAVNFPTFFENPSDIANGIINQINAPSDGYTYNSIIEPNTKFNFTLSVTSNMVLTSFELYATVGGMSDEQLTRFELEIYDSSNELVYFGTSVSSNLLTNGIPMILQDMKLTMGNYTIVLSDIDTPRINRELSEIRFLGCVDTDNDGLPNHLDLDSDNDGIPDNVEAQSTVNYLVPSGTVDENGTFSAIYGVNGILPVDSDEDNISDMLDSDADNDGVADINESGLTLTGTDANNDGIDDAVNASYVDVNGDVNNPSNDLSNASGDTTEIAYREVPIVASNDIGITVNGSLGGQAIANVSVNDTLNGNSFTLGVDVNMTVAGNTPLVINVITGEVSVAVGTVAGTYVETYTICENTNPSNCADANVSVLVSTATILGTDDSNNSVNGSNGGTAIANVTANDTLNGNAVTLGTDVNITSVSNVDFMIDPSTGAVTVPSQTAAGVYTEQYTLCEMLNPSNCVERNVTITVNPAIIDAVDDDFASMIVLNTLGGVAGDVTATGNDSLNGMDVNDSLITLSIVSIDNNLTGVTLDNNGSLSIEANATVGVYRVRYELCEVLNPTNCDEANVSIVVLVDTDRDGIADIYDIDDDNDGIPDLVEENGNATRDTDGDGVIDSLDLDADNDGILDIIEANGVDVDADGRVDNIMDSDNDGLADLVDHNPSVLDNPSDITEALAISQLIIVDTDSDGVRDAQDVDSDNDGISDLLEAGTSATYDVNNDGMIDISTGIGVDENGVPLAVTSVLLVIDTDNDSVPDYRDLDSDNDGLNDVTEAGGADVDANGLIDSLDNLIESSLLDNNGNGINDLVEVNNENLSRVLDVNADGIIDDMTDTDGDGIPDVTDEVDSVFGTAAVPESNDDKVVADILRDVDHNTTAVVNVLTNDIMDNLDVSTLQIVGTKNVRESLVVNGEGVWHITNNNEISFTPEVGFLFDPSDINYSLNDMNGVRLESVTVSIHYRSLVREDIKVANLREPVTVAILDNDNGDLNVSSVRIVLPEGFMRLHPNASFTGKMLIVPEQGTWQVNENGTITYRSETGVEVVDPTPISYSVVDNTGKLLNTDTTIVLHQSIVAEVSDEEDCESYDSDSVSTFSNSGLGLLILFGTLLSMFFFRKEKLGMK